MKTLLIALALTCLFIVGSGSTFQSKPQFEYKFEYKMNEKKANELGSQGWELVTIGSGSGITSNVNEYVFKRPR